MSKKLESFQVVKGNCFSIPVNLNKNKNDKTLSYILFLEASECLKILWSKGLAKSVMPGVSTHLEKELWSRYQGAGSSTKVDCSKCERETAGGLEFKGNAS